MTSDARIDRCITWTLVFISAFLLIYDLPACGLVSQNGLVFDPEDNAILPATIGPQLDAAWDRDMRLTGPCEVHLKVTQLHNELQFYIHAGAIDRYGKKFWGLSYPNYITRLAMVDGQIPAAAHEIWHQMLRASGAWPDGDIDHIGPCWDDVDGETPFSLP